jgi:hypothetical protein
MIPSDPMDHVNAEQQFCELLACHFSVAQMKQFLRWRRGGERMLAYLPDGPISPMSFAEHAVSQLKREGMLDLSFIADLSAARPRLKPALKHSARMLGIDVAGLSPASITVPHVSFWAVMETALAFMLATLVVMLCGLPGLSGVALSALIVPFTLLRSPESTALAVNWYTRYDAWIVGKLGSDASDGLDSVRSLFSLRPAAAIASAMLRVTGAVVIRLVATLRHPIAGVRAMTTNWRYAVLSMDLTTPPELVPNTGGQDLQATVIWGFLTLFFLLGTFAGTVGALVGVLYQLLVLPIPLAGQLFAGVIILFALGTCALGLYHILGRALASTIIGCAALIFRFSVKSTAVVWSPLLLVSPPTAERRLPIDIYLEYLRESGPAKVARAVAWFFVLTLALTVGEHLELLRFDALHELVDLERGVPEQLFPWQLTAGLAGLAVLVRDYFVVGRYRYFIDAELWTLPHVEKLAHGCSVLIRVLVLITGALTVQILADVLSGS